MTRLRLDKLEIIVKKGWGRVKDKKIECIGITLSYPGIGQLKRSAAILDHKKLSSMLDKSAEYLKEQGLTLQEIENYKLDVAGKINDIYSGFADSYFRRRTEIQQDEQYEREITKMTQLDQVEGEFDLSAVVSDANVVGSSSKRKEHFDGIMQSKKDYSDFYKLVYDAIEFHSGCAGLKPDNDNLSRATTVLIQAAKKHKPYPNQLLDELNNYFFDHPQSNDFREFIRGAFKHVSLFDPDKKPSP